MKIGRQEFESKPWSKADMKFITDLVESSEWWIHLAQNLNNQAKVIRERMERNENVAAHVRTLFQCILDMRADLSQHDSRMMMRF
jgi:uncharacterized protein (UPF0305 family)